MSDTAHIIKILTDLKKSEGWQYLQDTIIKDDILKAAMDMAENKPMTSDEFNFRRGSMCAAKGYSTIVDTVIQKLQNEVTFDAALAAEAEKDEN